MDAAQGIDVSDNQGTIDWGRVAQAGITFAFIKATEGITRTDPQFQANWSGASKAGLLRGAYHYYRPGDDPQAQAENFLSAIQTGSGDLPPALDVELTGDSSTIIQGVWIWLGAVETKTGKTPILYTNPSFWASLGASASGFGRFPLWIADWDTAEPTVPAGWATWTFWQTSNIGAVSGIQGNVDLDEFQGSLMNLQQMARR